MKTSPGPSTAPREWTIYVCPVHDGPIPTSASKIVEESVIHTPTVPCERVCESVEVVERASLDRVVEERDELREELERLNRLWEKHNTCGLCPYRKAVQDENERLRAALQSGEGERHEG